MVNGGRLGYKEAFFSDSFNRAVPMSFFGEYYLLRSLAAENSTITHIIPSLYCRRRFRRPLPPPFYDNPVETDFTLNVPMTGHTMRKDSNGRLVVSDTAPIASLNNRYFTQCVVCVGVINLCFQYATVC